MSPSTITDWILAIGTVALAIIAIFQDKIRALVMRPRLNVSIKLEPPDCMAVISVSCASDNFCGCAKRCAS